MLLLAPVAICVALVVFTTLVHAGGLALLWNWRVRILEASPNRSVTSMHVLMVPTVAAVILLHLVEACIYGAAYFYLGATGSPEQAVAYAVSIYSTTAAEPDLAAGWRLLPPLQALQGLLMLAWSIAFLVHVRRLGP